MVKMNFTDIQTAFEYAIYMIVGSYFKKTNCASSLQERSMRLQYCEQKLENQYRMEAVCISYVEQELLSKLPESFWNREMQKYKQLEPGCLIFAIYGAFSLSGFQKKMQKYE